MKKIKLISFLLTVCLLVSASCIFAFAVEDAEYTYDVLGDNKIKITGCTLSEDTAEISIPSEIDGKVVAYIGEKAFFKRESLQKVVLPESIISIGNYAFSECFELKEINMPNNLEYIGAGAFSYCGKLEAVKFGLKITEITENAFKYCEALKSVQVTENLTSVGRCAFGFCKSLEEFSVRDDIVHAMSIDPSFPYEPEDTSTMPKRLQYIGDYAFRGTALKEVIIPQNVSYIGIQAFLGCSQLTTLKVSMFNRYYCDNGYNSIFNYDKTRLVSIGETVSGIYEIPDTVKYVDEDVFLCHNITGIIIPESMTAIEEGTFAISDNIKSIIMPKTIIKIGGYTFSGITSDTHIYYNGTLEDWNNIDVHFKTPFSRATVHFINGISVIKQPNKTEYFIGEGLDTTGMKVEAAYSDGSTFVIPYVKAADTKAASVPGDQRIEVKYGCVTTGFNINVKGVLFGDLNSDDRINAVDVLVLRKYLAGQSVKINLVAADVNADSRVNAADALRMRQYLVDNSIILGIK